MKLDISYLEDRGGLVKCTVIDGEFVVSTTTLKNNCDIIMRNGNINLNAIKITFTTETGIDKYVIVYMTESQIATLDTLDNSVPVISFNITQQINTDDNPPLMPPLMVRGSMTLYKIYFTHELYRELEAM
jgi:hypothetical protein